MNLSTPSAHYTDPQDFPGLDVYAVVGNPIEHSKSPTIHRCFAEQAEQKMYYGRIQPELDGFVKAVNDFFASRGRGLNVTVPFKLEAYALADIVTPRAQLAGAVNTLWVQDGTIFGDNTDGAGLVRDLLAQGAALHGARILLLGAGGASRGVLAPLLEQKPASVMLANRSHVKALELVELFRQKALLEKVALTAGTLSALEDQAVAPFDVVINATASGLSDQSPLTQTMVSRIFVPSSFAYDMVYGKTTLFMQQAIQKGARVSDGLGMLVEQAADAFLIWRGADLAQSIDPRQVLADLRR